MALDQAQEQTIRAWLREKHISEVCPACHSAADWVCLEVVDVPVRWPAELHTGGPGFPLAPLGCRNCGYIMFFSAAKIGLSSATDEPDEG